MGNIQVSENLEDTYFNLAETILHLRRQDILCIILGGSHELTYAQYLGYQELYEMVNVVVVDERLDMKKATETSAELRVLSHAYFHAPTQLPFQLCASGLPKLFLRSGGIGKFGKHEFRCLSFGHHS
jgi:hypothetical protein